MNKCPHCGYCPACGRSNAPPFIIQPAPTPVFPAVPPSPPHPGFPTTQPAIGDFPEAEPIITWEAPLSDRAVAGGGLLPGVHGTATITGWPSVAMGGTINHDPDQRYGAIS